MSPDLVSRARCGILMPLRRTGIVRETAFVTVPVLRSSATRCIAPGKRAVRGGASLIQYPGVLGAAALAGIDDQRAFFQSDARQPARDDVDAVAPGQHERAEIDVAGREALFGAGRAGGERQRRLRDKTLGLAFQLVAERGDGGLGRGGPD